MPSCCSGGWPSRAAAMWRRKAWTSYDMGCAAEGAGRGDLQRHLGAFGLVMLGIGGIIGAGVFVLTGLVAHDIAGPSVVVSYAIAGLASMVAALCYAEFAAEMPIVGGAFSYVCLCFGEYAGWICGMDLILEYTLSAAAVAKGFTAYLAALCGFDLSSVRWQFGPIIQIDPIALASVLVLSAVLAWGIRESTFFNSAVNIVNLLLILFIISGGASHADAANYQPFMPYGIRGTFAGASIVFFSFVGFDAVATAAEEAKNPARNLPIGLIGSLTVSILVYAAMSLTLTGMQPYTEIDVNAPYAAAFTAVGWGWATKLVAAGALTGIVTSLLVSLLGQTRIYVVLGRARLLPPSLARVNARTRTPLLATVVTAVTAGLLALLFDIELLAELVSIGTCVAFLMVCAGVLHRRYFIRGQGQPTSPLAWRLASITAAAIGFSISFIEYAPWPVPVVFLLLWALITLSFYLLPQLHTPEGFKVPLVPIVPSVGMLFTLHLIGSLGWPAYVRWVVWFCIGAAIYVFYGMWRSQDGFEGMAPITAGPDSSHSSNHTAGAAVGAAKPDAGLTDQSIIVTASSATQPHLPPQRLQATSPGPSSGLSRLVEMARPSSRTSQGKANNARQEALEAGHPDNGAPLRNHDRASPVL